MKINTERIEFIDALRCLAVLSVVFYHFYSRFSPPISSINYLPFKITPPFFINYGYYGVQLFFVISGFVIFHTLTSSDSFGVFIKKRLIRLFPALILCSVITFLAQEFISHQLYFLRSKSYWDFLPGITFSPPQFWNFLLGRNDINYIDFAYWSLFVEMEFYIVGGLLFFLKPDKFANNWIFTTFTFMCIRILTSPKLHFLFSSDTNSLFDEVYQWHTLLHLSYWVYFSLGIFFYALYSTKKIPSIKATTCMVTMIFTEFYFLGSPVLIFYLICILILFLVFIYKATWLSFLNNRVFLLIGSISYPFYLIHQNIGLILMNKFADWIAVTALNKYVPLLVLAILGLLAYVISNYFEAPIGKFFKSRLMLRQRLSSKY